MYMKGFDKQKRIDNTNCIMTGYYSAYYINNSRKAKSPNELIKLMYREQNQDGGMDAIEKIKNLERRNL